MIYLFSKKKNLSQNQNNKIKAQFHDFGKVGFSFLACQIFLDESGLPTFKNDATCTCLGRTIMIDNLNAITHNLSQNSNTLPNIFK